MVILFSVMPNIAVLVSFNLTFIQIFKKAYFLFNLKNHLEALNIPGKFVLKRDEVH